MYTIANKSDIAKTSSNWTLTSRQLCTKIL